MASTCPVCELPGDLVEASAAAVEVGTLAARLEHRPVVACPERHGASPPELVDAAMQAVTAQVPRCRSRMLRSDRCAGCGTGLDMPARRTVRGVSTPRGDGAVLTIELDVPLTRCPDCGLDQVPSRSHEDLVVVIPALFAAPAGRGRPGPT